MANVDTGSSAHRQVVHTERHSPIEVVLSRIVYYVFGVIEVFLALRFVLRMLGANAQTAFVQFIYSVSAIFMGKDYELSVYSKDDFIWDKTDLLVAAS